MTFLGYSLQLIVMFSLWGVLLRAMYLEVRLLLAEIAMDATDAAPRARGTMPRHERRDLSRRPRVVLTRSKALVPARP